MRRENRVSLGPLAHEQSASHEFGDVATRNRGLGPTRAAGGEKWVGQNKGRHLGPETLSDNKDSQPHGDTHAPW